MDEQQEGSRHNAVDEIPLRGTLLGNRSAVGGASEADTAVMPVADVMALLQAVREEQLDSLKMIADGVQQLQSQVMVLGESARVSEGNTSLVLDRLAALEVRMGSIPVPVRPQTKPQTNSWQHQLARAGLAAGAGVDVKGRAARVSQPPVMGNSPPPPPAAVEEPGRVPTWQVRAEPEPARPHFMRNASPQQGRASPASTSPAAAAPVKTVTAAAAVGASGGGGGASVSPEAAAKEAKRVAFMQDRARIQERIAASKGVGTAPASAKPAPTSSSHGTPEANKQATSDTPPEAFEKPFATSTGGVGSFSSNPSFLDGGGGIPAAGVREVDETADWLEREREQRGEREMARRQEEERVARQREEAKKLREEEEARKLREAEEARLREKARREVEAKRQAKTRVLMSSLFDKDETEDGNSLFAGLGGAALPVFHDDNSSSTNHVTDLTERAADKRVTTGSTSELAAPVLPSNVGGGAGGGGGSLFAGIEEPSTSRGDMFDRLDKPGSPLAEAYSSPMGGVPSAKKLGSGGSRGGALFPDLEPLPLQASKMGAGDGGRHEDGMVGGGSSGYSGLFDSSPPVESSSTSLANTAVASTKPNNTAAKDEPDDDMDDFFSSLEAATSATPSGLAAKTTATHSSIFEEDEFGGIGGRDEDVFATPLTTETDRAAVGRGGERMRSGGGNTGGALVDPRDGARAGTSLFDRMEFSIEPGDDDDRNVFGGGGGRSGDASGSFFSAMGEDFHLTSRGDGDVVGESEGDARTGGMTEVSL